MTCWVDMSSSKYSIASNPSYTPINIDINRPL